MAISDAKLSKMAVRIMDGQRWSAAWKRAAKRWRKIKFAEVQKKLVAELLEDGLYRISIGDIVEARAVARRLLRERDEARAENKIFRESLAYDDNLIDDYYIRVEHLVSDRDALAAENARLREEMQRWADDAVNETNVSARLREALLQVEWVEIWGSGDGTNCVWCLNGEHEGHAPDCPRQVALGLAK